MTVEPLNLRLLYGKRWLLGKDPCAGKNVREDPWMIVLPLKDSGTVWAFGSKLLGVEVKTDTKVKIELLRLYSPYQHGNDYTTFLMTPEEFESHVQAKLLKPYSKRRSSSTAHIEAYRFRPRQNGAPGAPVSIESSKPA